MKKLVTDLAKQAERKYYGKYLGFVKDNQDPEKRGRLKLQIPSVFGTQITEWALPCLPFGGQTQDGSDTPYGFFMIPQVGSQVWAEFAEGELFCPIWVGVFWQQGADVPVEAALAEPTTRMLKTPSGHVLQFDDKSGAEKITLKTPADNALTLNDAEKTVTLLDSNGNCLVMNDKGMELKGKELVLDFDNITIKDGKVTVTASGGATFETSSFEVK
ncbi:MAG: phage baseplate assembly protein V [Pseudomonadales bacterium]